MKSPPKENRSQPEETGRAPKREPTTTPLKPSRIPVKIPKKQTPSKSVSWDELLFAQEGPELDVDGTRKNINNPIMTRKRQHAARHSKKRRRRRRIMARKRQRGGKFDIQKKIEKLGIEFHPFSLSKRRRYQYLGRGTFIKKRLARGDPGINRLDRIAKQHYIDYSNAKNLRDKWKADLKMVHAIDALPGKKSTMEKLSRNIIAAKRKFKL